ncbi:MAG: tetratricopeptide repeat protein [Nitrospinae bacterium]|nr:tetratricopeptide repeat protein [Nitrospinota bacterium]
MIRVGICLLAIILFLSPQAVSAGQTAVERGMKFFREGNYQEAMKSFHVSRPRDLNKEAYMAWGLSAFRLGKFQSALLKLEKAFKIDPADGNLLTLIAQCQLNLQKPLEALKNLRATEKLKVSDRGEAYFLWAVSAGLAGSHEEAIEKFQSALALKPDKEFEIRLGMADSLKELKLLDQAGEQAERALRLRPGDTLGMERLGLIHLKMGRYGEAERMFDDLVRVNPNSAVNQYNLACVRARLGKQAEACVSLKSAFAFGVDRASAMNDEDLAGLKEADCFKELMKEPPRR